jgi:hypothetical protein
MRAYKVYVHGRVEEEETKVLAASDSDLFTDFTWNIFPPANISQFKFLTHH